MKKSGRFHQIEDETILRPAVIADHVVREAAYFLYHNFRIELGMDRLSDILYDHAIRYYDANARFRARVKRNETYGRDFLHTFMRHWLAAELKGTNVEAYNKLPRSFDLGHPIPDRYVIPQIQQEARS